MTDPISVNYASDLPHAYRDTPIGRLLEYHNLARPHTPVRSPQLLIATCMDHRIRLRTPENFAYIIRTGGGNIRCCHFNLSYAIAIGGISAVAVVGHTRCGMSGVTRERDRFIRGLVDRAGWTASAAREHFDNDAPDFEIGDEADHALAEAHRLRELYPGVLVAPLLYRLEDHRLYLLETSPRPHLAHPTLHAFPHAQA